MVADKKQLNIRIPSDLWDELEKIDMPKQNVVSDALRLYFASNGQQNTSNEKDLRSEIEYLRSKLDEALKLVHQSQILQVQQQRLLSDLNTKESTKKKWWKIW